MLGNKDMLGNSNFNGLKPVFPQKSPLSELLNLVKPSIHQKQGETYLFTLCNIHVNKKF